MTVIYIAGPITGLPDLNKPAFDAEEERLLEEGHAVYNPHTIPQHPSSLKDPEEVWRYYMRICIPRLCMCGEARFLPGWEKSRGAVWEHRIAEMLGLKLSYVSEKGDGR